MGVVAGFTGTRKGMTEAQVKVLGSLLARVSEMHHGGALGADREAVGLCKRMGIKTVPHLPVGHSPNALIARNHKMVDEVGELFAAPYGMEEELRSGTWATVRYAKKMRKLVTIIWPDGSLQMEP